MRDDLASLMLASIIALVLLLSPASGFTLDMQCVEDNAANYNRNIENAPYLLTSFLGSEKINLDLVKDDGSLLKAGLDMVDGRIERVIQGGFDDASISFAASERDMNEVIASKDKIATFKRLTDEGRINIQAEGLWAQAKLKALLSSASVLQFGYELFFG
ncbi:MAG: hypothetical protein KBA97_08930 [Methanothrix sp.]|nr:hypothetical protein [Methanothrix sp.]